MSIIFENKYFLININENAMVTDLVDKINQKSVIKEQTPFGKIVLTDRTELCANTAEFEGDVLKIGYPNGFYANVGVEIFEDYFKFSLINVSSDDFWTLTFVNMLSLGECGNFTVSGMALTLNVKMGEYPCKNEELSATVYTHIGYKDAAFVVIGITEDIMNATMRKIVDKIPFGTVPKAAYSGPYASDCKDANRNYTVLTGPITPQNVDEHIELFKEFGLTQVNLHQAHMYRTGDFEVYNKELYPNGRKDLRYVVDRFHENGINSFLHCYAFFIDPYNSYKSEGSRYLQPVPHKDLALSRTFTLALDMDDEQTEIQVKESLDGIDDVFGFYIEQSPILWVDNELMYITAIKDNKIFVDRGAFKTTVTEHKKDAEVKQLRSYFTHLMPKCGSELFYEVARNTADFYNELDLDGFYEDAIDGAGHLDGDEFSWYHSTDFFNEIFKYLKKPPIFNCCYGPQYPGHWFARTMMGAFDTPGRGYRDFVDLHVDHNRKFAERMGLVSELGWWRLFPVGQPLNWQKKVMWHEDVEYLMCKVLATNVSFSWLVGFGEYKNIPLLSSYRPIIKEYTALNKANYFSDEIKEILKQPQSEFHLCKENGEYYFKRMYTDRQRIESFDEGRNVLTYNNKFAAQTPKIRIEALWSAQEYDSEAAKPIALFDQNKKVVFDNKYKVCNRSTDKMRGMGVWICGDGKGEVINIRLRSQMHKGTGYGDHFVKIDFTGWRYYSYYELQNCEMKPEEYPPQQLNYRVFEDTIPFYASYDGDVNFDYLESVEVIAYPKGDYNIKLRDIVAVPQVSLELKNPTVKVNGTQICFDTVMKSTDYLEYDPETKECIHYDGLGNELARPKVIGDIKLESGNNTVAFTADCDSKILKRAALTLITLGDRI